MRAFGLNFDAPILSSVQPWALALSVAAAIAIGWNDSDTRGMLRRWCNALRIGRSLMWPSCPQGRGDKEMTMTKEIERRDFLQGAGLLAGVAAVGMVAQPASAEGASKMGAKTMTYEPKPLSIDPKSINGISEKVLVSHHENNYVGAVKQGCPAPSVDRERRNLCFTANPRRASHRCGRIWFSIHTPMQLAYSRRLLSNKCGLVSR